MADAPPQRLADFGRFSEPALFILISLADGPKHGYAMLADIERLTTIRIGPGTLYGALARLEDRGWVTALPMEDRRRPYLLTEAGAVLLKSQLASLRAVATVGLERLAQA